MELSQCNNHLIYILLFRHRKFYSFVYAFYSLTHSPRRWCSRLEFASDAAGWVFESQPRQISVVKTGCDNSTAKRSGTGLSVTGPRRWPLWMDATFHSKCNTLKNLIVRWPRVLCIVHNLQPFTGDGENKWVKNARVGRKTQSKL